MQRNGAGNGEECVPMLMLNHSETAQETPVTGRAPRRTSSSADRTAKLLEMGAPSISPVRHSGQEHLCTELLCIDIRRFLCCRGIVCAQGSRQSYTLHMQRLYLCLQELLAERASSAFRRLCNACLMLARNVLSSSFTILRRRFLSRCPAVTHVTCGSGGGVAVDVVVGGGSSSAAVNPSSTTANLIQLGERAHRGSATSAASIMAIATKVET
ncbi:hypothetical protein HPB48_020747 [Haemaphysalis longicornis]|uniref:Uncharacterized protein n=1 Tax=Haemaphysalis longicornis TaxID=44386 RepID=A0A9J6H3Q1_HAELO|nr:hypothetical protein HPB48_020747 [Haemaphysalis longicornis]